MWSWLTNGRTYKRWFDSCRDFEMKLPNFVIGHVPCMVHWVWIICKLCCFQKAGWIRFQSKLFASHLSCCTLFATSINSVLPTAWHDAKSRGNIILNLARILRRRRTDRMTSFRYPIAVRFPWMVTLSVIVCMNTLDRVLLWLFSPYVFFIIDNQQDILSYQIQQLPGRVRGSRAHNLGSHQPFCMDCFVHGNIIFSFR